MNTERPETPAERELAAFRREVGALKAEKINLLDVELGVLKCVKAIGRELMVEAMARADTEAPEVEVDGARWGNQRRQGATYQTIFGPVEVERSTYQQAGRGRVAIPMDLRLGIVEGAYTPMLARIMTRTLAVTTEHEGAELLGEIGLAAVSSATLSRIPRAMAARYEMHRPVVETNMRSRDPIPEGTTTVQVSLDGVMVPQDGEHARPRGRKTKSPEPPRHEQRYGVVGPPGPANDDGTMGRSWHEASVGTLAYFDEDGIRLKTTYVARMPEPHKATTVATLEAELHAVLEERPDLDVVFASDGAQGQWAALAEMKSRLPSSFTGKTMDLVDAFHVAEYIKKAANAIEGTDTWAARVQAATWRETVKERPNGADTVLRSMRALKPRVELASRIKDLETAIGYLDNQNDAGRMDYVEAQRRHYPIGTGIVEAAAKTMVGVRMKRAGARFSQHGGQTIMTFRAALLSERFDSLHLELHATYTRSVRIAA